ncbi:hydrogenase expression/formation protein HypC [Actinoplanes campanulatus]|uniref:Hydrogenase expression/formation protein HypC n=1 Tax=Actinoplanes campanulatus TaxID=113559 RepID=A0A7W5ARR3_9ACTN|nr:HypC/HybG/HupF family hydrogenase formation chaperone [Actinoplanes campanulatus]MBB3101085.1 hydrogenase expression/formation protein HypC [Actinoplanes campanulatus]GGN51760.1 hydrogenase assembly protein HypC [Actinoplanes campanulatus]GID42054.1 hydrogenase assembly protein HypC [Actinoplanes campanulatus]
MCLGIPGLVTEVEQEDGLRVGTVDFGGVRKRVCLAYAPEASAGDYVIVHVGFAISVVDAAEAQRTLAVLRAMGDVLDQELGP